MSESKYELVDQMIVDEDNADHHGDKATDISSIVSDKESNEVHLPPISNGSQMQVNELLVIDSLVNQILHSSVMNSDLSQQNVLPKMTSELTNVECTQEKDLSPHLDDEKTINVAMEQNTNITNNGQILGTEEKLETSQSISQLSPNVSTSSPEENESTITGKETELNNTSITDTVTLNNSANKLYNLKRNLDEKEFKPKKHRQSFNDKYMNQKLNSDEDKSELFKPSNNNLSEINFKVPPLKIAIPITDDDNHTNDKNGNMVLPYVGTSDQSNSSKTPDEQLAQSTLSTIATADLKITNVSMSISSDQADDKLATGSKDDKPTIDIAAGSFLKASESGTTDELPKSSDAMRKLVKRWSKHYFGHYVTDGFFNRLDKNEIVFNDYQLLLIMKKQINDKRKKMFVVHPKPPSGFKDYLLNRRTYVLAENSISFMAKKQTPPPVNLHEQLKKLFVEQEKERRKLCLQHIVEKEKLVLNVEQEILRVHGRAARSLANQQFPFSFCTILGDEEVCHIKNNKHLLFGNRQNKYNGRIFLSWLQELDDKWEKIKESMLLRHHNEAESLHAVQKMYWGWKMNELPLDTNNSNERIDEEHVPIVFVSDDFDIFPI